MPRVKIFRNSFETFNFFLNGLTGVVAIFNLFTFLSRNLALEFLKILSTSTKAIFTRCDIVLNTNHAGNCTISQGMIVFGRNIGLLSILCHCQALFLSSLARSSAVDNNKNKRRHTFKNSPLRKLRKALVSKILYRSETQFKTFQRAFYQS